MIFTGTTAAGETVTYRDGKRYLWFLSFIPPLIPLKDGVGDNLRAIKAKFRAIAFEPTGLGVADFTKLHNDEIARWVKFLTETGYMVTAAEDVRLADQRARLARSR